MVFYPKSNFLISFLYKDEQIELGKQELTAADVQKKVKEYNAQINSNLFMSSV